MSFQSSSAMRRDSGSVSERPPMRRRHAREARPQVQLHLALDVDPFGFHRRRHLLHVCFGQEAAREQTPGILSRLIESRICLVILRIRSLGVHQLRA
ncbi:hypothetical protein [Burkholderia sp. AU28942]|nr:hypothetical protein [Burkholderia sp. AU28942]